MVFSMNDFVDFCFIKTEGYITNGDLDKKESTFIIHTIRTILDNFPNVKSQYLFSNLKLLSMTQFKITEKKF